MSVVTDEDDLLVRVTGYNPYFTSLEPAVQADSVARHEHALR